MLKLTNLIKYLLAVILLTPVSYADTIDDIIWDTDAEVGFPYSFINKQGEKTGASIDIVVALLRKLNSKRGINDINNIPWVRGYNDVQNNKNTALFTTFRSKEREPLFKWVGHMGTGKTLVIAKKSSHIKINSPEDLKKYKIGAVREDISQQALNALGIKNDSLYLVHTNVQNIKKLNSDKIDLVSCIEFQGIKSIKDSELNPDDFESVYVLNDFNLDIAFNKQTDDLIVKQLQDALDSLKISNSPGHPSEYDVIMKKYDLSTTFQAK